MNTAPTNVHRHSSSSLGRLLAGAAVLGVVAIGIDLGSTSTVASASSTAATCFTHMPTVVICRW
jgi:hypothetical protein